MRQIYAHPLSSYCWKVFIAFDEVGIDYELRHLGPDFPENQAELALRWPLAKMPLLVDGADAVAESSVIIERIAPRLIPAGAPGVHVRLLDRVFDTCVMAPMSKMVNDRVRPEGRSDTFGIEEARGLLDKAYSWLETAIGAPWAAGAAFTLADCAAAPSLFYADKVHPFRARFPNLTAYLARLEARPSVARAIAGAQPYWHMFPYA